MEIKTLKGVNLEKWLKFKSMAAKSNVPMGKLFEIMVDTYSKKEDPAWEAILNGEKILSDNEAEEMERIVNKIRKERGFRNVSIN